MSEGMKVALGLGIGVGALWWFSRNTAVGRLTLGAGLEPINRKTTGIAGAVGDVRQIVGDARSISEDVSSIFKSVKGLFGDDGKTVADAGGSKSGFDGANLDPNTFTSGFSF